MEDYLELMNDILFQLENIVIDIKESKCSDSVYAAYCANAIHVAQDKIRNKIDDLMTGNG